MDRVRQEKVQRFEEFVDHRLNPDLVKAIARRDKVFEEHKAFSGLKSNIQRLEENNLTHLKTMLYDQAEVYAQAEVIDTSRIFVDVGLGFHVKFTWSEALKEHINVRGEASQEGTQSMASIKAYIKLVLEGIRELLNLPD